VLFRSLDAPAVAAAIAAAPAVVAQLEVPAATVAALAERMVGTDGTPRSMLVLDPAPAPPGLEPLPEALLARVDVLVPNLLELIRITESFEPTTFSETVNALRRLRRFGFVGDAVVTLGRRGAIVLTRDDEVRPVRGELAYVVDPSGAGDAFCATLVDRMLDGHDVVAATELAVIAGALATTDVGAQTALPRRHSIEMLAALP
jgi:ribokinase